MGNGVLKSISRVVVPAIVVLAAACGGGGGGGNTSPTSPAPVTLTSLAPAAANAGAGATVLTATGSGFTTASVIEWNGTALTTSYVSSTSLTATIPAADFMETGTVPVTVSNAASGGATSGVVNFTIASAVPTLVSVSPTSIRQNQGNVTLTLTGTNFTSTTQVSPVGSGVSSLSTVYVSPTQLNVSFTTSLSSPAAGSTLTIGVTDPASRNTPSNTLSVTVTPGVPVTASLGPSSVYVNQGSLILAVTGEFFTPTSVVYVNGTPRPTAFNRGQLLAALTALDVSAVGTAAITVEDSYSGGAASNSTPLTIQARPTVGIIALSPAAVPSGNSDFTLTVTGFGFAADSVVDWNGTALTTTYVSSATLNASVPAAQVASVGMAQVTVVNPANEGGASSPQTANIVGPSIDAVSYQINNAHSGTINFQTASLPTSAAWSVNIGATPSYSLIVSNRVYVMALQYGNSQLFALDATTGATLWGPATYSGYAGIAYDNGLLFVNNGSGAPGGGVLTAVDATTGTTKWSAAVPGQFATSSPAVASQGIVYMLDDGDLTAFNELTGEQLWQGGATGTDGSVAVSADGVYVAQPCMAFDFQPLLGTPLWSTDTGCDGGGGNTPVVAGGRVYAPLGVGGYSGNIYDAESTTLLGSFSYSGPPALTATTAYTIFGSTLQSVTLSNNQVNWSFSGDGGLDTSPIVVNNYVFIGSSSGNLYALDADTGNLLWTGNPGAGISNGNAYTLEGTTGLSAGDGLLVVPAGNTVTAYVLSTNP